MHVFSIGIEDEDLIVLLRFLKSSFQTKLYAVSNNLLVLSHKPSVVLNKR